MTNVYQTPEKGERRNLLFQIGLDALKALGWTVERVQGSGKASVRRIRRGKDARIISIRTTQDTSIAFPRNKEDTDWVTLSGVDSVVAVSVDDAHEPKFALVHLLDGDDLRDRFNRSYKARIEAGHSIPPGRGVWLPLYIRDSGSTPAHVGGGVGLDVPPMARVPLAPKALSGASPSDDVQTQLNEENEQEASPPEAPLSIAEAKRRLAVTFGVDPGNIKIIIDG